MAEKKPPEIVRIEGKDWRKKMGEVPEIQGISWETGKPLKSGYGSPPKPVRAVRATRMIGNPAAAEDIARWASRAEEHHVVLMKLLEPFLMGRTVEEADQIIKRTSKALGGRKLGNHPDNLRTLIKELHRKNTLSAHGILKRYYDMQGAKAYAEYDEIKQLPKLTGDTVYGKKFEKWYKLSEMQDGHSLEMIDKIRKMSLEQSADTLAGYLDLTIPRLEGAVLASVWLDPVSRAKGPGGIKSYAQEILETFPDGEKHLMETLADIKASEMQRFSFNDPSRPVPGQAKVLTEQTKAHQESAELLEKIRRFEKESPFGEVKLSKVKPPPLSGPPTKPPKELEDLINALNGSGTATYNMSFAPGIGLEDVDRVTQQAVDVSKGAARGAVNLGKEVAQDTAQWVKNVPEASRAARIDNVMALQDFTKAGTTVGRRVAALMPFVGAAGDVWDVTERYKTMMDDPNTGFADWLDKAQFGIASATVGTTWWAEPVNTALGLTNLGIDIGRTIVEEDKRKAAGNMMRALGTAGMHEIRNFAKGFL
tara:strand:+ start:38 stop:1648 length:1611 start_codon:yes stop_codon:yes gene_type:complete